MKFEELQAIWDTQNDRPIFSMNDSRLAVGLYQQREQSRRRLFKEQFAPVYLALLLIAAANAFVFVAFLVKTVSRFRPTDPSMSVWDGAVLAAAIIAPLGVVFSMYVLRRRHERTQNVFAPSLREELERGIAQLQFELRLHSKPRSARIAILICVGTTVFLWETGRLNGDPVPWMMLVYASICAGPGLWYGVELRDEAVARLMERKHALESMLAVLDEEKA